MKYLQSIFHCCADLEIANIFLLIYAERRHKVGNYIL